MKRSAQFVFVMVGVYILILLTVPAFGSKPVLGIHFNLGGGNMFYRNPTPGTAFFIDESVSDPNVWSGHLLVDGHIWDDHEIRNTSISLTPSLLLGDHSHSSNPFDPMNPSIAKGLFKKGGILTITGSITTIDGQTELFPYGTILEAKVDFDFWVMEHDTLPTGDTLISQLKMKITGGELKTGAVTGFVLPNVIKTDLSLLWCRNTVGMGMGTLNNFDSDAYYNGPSTMQIYPVPEPVSFSLLAFGSLLTLRRTRQKSLKA